MASGVFIDPSVFSGESTRAGRSILSRNSAVPASAVSVPGLSIPLRERLRRSKSPMPSVQITRLNATITAARYSAPLVAVNRLDDRQPHEARLGIAESSATTGRSFSP